MIFRELSLSNFGIYGGDYCFDLSPIGGSNYNRPVVLFRGKNGVGKSTILEAIRLCLHGPLSLGNRVSRAEYVKYLSSRIHRPFPPSAATSPQNAEVSLSFDYVRTGQRINVQARRRWRYAGAGIVETLTVSEAGIELSDLSVEQREAFLRDLVSPSAADIFFFDSERLHVLAEQDTSSTLLATSIKSLLGLDVVERLQRDLDVYLTREGKAVSTPGFHEEIEDIGENLAKLEEERGRVHADLSACRDSITTVQKHIALQEQRIAGEGDIFANQLADLRAREISIKSEIERQRAAAIERCSGLLPFSLAPGICKSLVDRVDAEESIQIAQASERVLSERISLLNAQFDDLNFWQEAGITLASSERQRLAEHILSTLRASDHSQASQGAGLLLHLSDQDRQTLRGWIEQATGSTPSGFIDITTELASKANELDGIRTQLRRVPTDDVLRPLVEELNRLNQELGAMRQQERTSQERLRQLDNEIDQQGAKMRLIRQRFADMEGSDLRLRTAARTQLVLEEYAAELMREKIALLQEALAERFNELCRKEHFLDEVYINPATFAVTLIRSGQEFDRERLSAGEKQLLATATMWALRDVSRLPVPVIVDTPVGRLDSDHRNTMLHEYFPNASHQVILLSTDAEIDEEGVREMESYLSHTYTLYFDMETGRTQVEARHSSNLAPEGEATPLLLREEVPVS